jgi:hypothetical protein
MNATPLSIKKSLRRVASAISITCALAGASAAGCGEGSDHYPTIAPASNGTPPMPLPLSGGSLLALRGGAAAVAADPEFDALYVVDLDARSTRSTIALHKGDEPGRLVEDSQGRVHVALRSGGAVVSVDPVKGRVLTRREVCAAPRGLAYDAGADAILVACAGGELVTLPAGGGAETRRLQLDRDLRDVVIQGAVALVSTFRSAELLTIDAAGQVVERRRPPSFAGVGATFDPDVAWRMVPTPDGGVAVAHQRASTQLIDISPAVKQSYQNEPDCAPSISHGAVTVFGPSGAPSVATPMLESAALPIDVAVTPDGAWLAVVAAGRSDVLTGPLAPALAPAVDVAPRERAAHLRVGGAIAVAFDAHGRLLVQTRARALWIDGKRMWLTSVPLDEAAIPASPGHELFHTPPGGGSLACASCHPEGREDGHVWSFSPIGPRRTQSLAGDVTDTAPFHWGGDLPDVTHLVMEVFVRRMGGDLHSNIGDPLQLSAWLATLPAPPASAPVDAAAVARGRALFEGDELACVTCHAGPKHTNNQTVDVGTGGPLQVPWLVGVAWRAPFRHDGCAATLRDRFTTCADDAHGAGGKLSASDLDDLVAYLETL